MYNNSLTKVLAECALKDALAKIDRLIIDMNGAFPSPASSNNIYQRCTANTDWVEGFWPGILYLAYELTNKKKYLKTAEKLLPEFYKRIDEKIAIETHDLGFLYVPSCVASYKLTGNKTAKAAALKAADSLLERYIEKGKYIQAWGRLNASHRMIVDCMNNLPLLYWASDVTGNSKYKDAAYIHAKTTMKYLIRPDFSSFHTFWFHADGTPDRGATCQGASDESCWARGQAWLVSGFPLTYKYTNDREFIDIYKKVTDYYIRNLPKDYVPYWDLSLNNYPDEERDSSAAAIALCGMLEMSNYIEDSKEYQDVIDNTFMSLYNNYSTKNDDASNGLLLHAVYSKPINNGVDECNIWGCYYYMEAIARILGISRGYW